MGLGMCVCVLVKQLDAHCAGDRSAGAGICNVCGPDEHLVGDLVGQFSGS